MVYEIYLQTIQEKSVCVYEQIYKYIHIGFYRAYVCTQVPYSEKREDERK